jgi:two-component system, chemotaxis family, chemotaxis protein CheY
MDINSIQTGGEQPDLRGQVDLLLEMVEKLLEMISEGWSDNQELRESNNKISAQQNSSAQSIAAIAPQTIGERKRGVLIIDDSKVLQLRLKMTVKALGYEVLGVAENGSEGVQQALLLNPQLIILDNEMPVMDGLGCLRTLREYLPDMKAIVCSATLTARLAQEYSELGVTEMLAKPVQLNQLLRAIKLAMDDW